MKLLSPPSSPLFAPSCLNNNFNDICHFHGFNSSSKPRNFPNHAIKNGIHLLKVRANAINDVSATVVDPGQAQVTWDIVVGTLAGVTPFIVAGIEFSKRIAAQRKCEVCEGSGLVLRDKKYYFRCPGCGEFLPWQSWKRFFTG